MHKSFGNGPRIDVDTWWRHQMETFSASLALCAGSSPVTRWIPPTKASDFDVFLNLRLYKRLSKQSRGYWFETPWRSLWRYCYECWLERFIHTDQDECPGLIDSTMSMMSMVNNLTSVQTTATSVQTTAASVQTTAMYGEMEALWRPRMREVNLNFLY